MMITADHRLRSFHAQHRSLREYAAAGYGSMVRPGAGYGHASHLRGHTPPHCWPCSASRAKRRAVRWPADAPSARAKERGRKWLILKRSSRPRPRRGCPPTRPTRISGWGLHWWAKAAGLHGCNVESAAYSPSLLRRAHGAGQGVSEGEKAFEHRHRGRKAGSAA